jgi:hypothetical protein
VVRRVLVIAFSLFFSAARPTGADTLPVRPGREIALPQDQVKDSFFAYVIGVIMSGVDVDLTNQDLREILTEFKTSLDLPFDLVDAVKQSHDTGSGKRTLSIDFNSPVKIPIPFAFLGYHPGAILSSQAVRLTEMNPAPSAARGESPATSVYVLRMEEGEIVVDVDDWIIFLLPTILDDLFVKMFAIFHYGGDWCCMLAGTGRRGGQIMEFFNFTHNYIIFPVPLALSNLGARLVNSDSSSY